MTYMLLLLLGVVFVAGRPADDESAVLAGAATETSAAALVEGTTKAVETTDSSRNWLDLLLGEEQYTQPEIISQEAAARPKVSGYGRRRRRSGEAQEAAESAAGISDVALDAVKIRNHGQKGELTRRQPLGYYKQKKAEGSRYRRQTSVGDDESSNAEVLIVREVDGSQVKIRNRGKYGNIAQTARHPAMVSSRLVFDDQFASQTQRRRRNSDKVIVANFIPFSEYDSRRVQILKVEQNDFLALPKRLAASQALHQDQQG